MKRAILTAAFGLALATGLPAATATIGLNFTDGWPTPMLQGETSDGFSNWTDSMGNFNGGGPNPQLGSVTLLGSSVTARWNAANTWAAGLENTSGQQLYRVYLDDGDGGSSLVSGDGIGVSVTISGLGAWMAANGDDYFAIRCYSSTDTDNASFRPVQVRAGAPVPADGVNQLRNLPLLDTITVPTLGPGDFPPNTTPDPTWGLWQSRGYGDSSAPLYEDIITLTIDSRDGSTRGTLAGFTITAVPEPGAIAMSVVTLGGALLAWRRRK